MFIYADRFFNLVGQDQESELTNDAKTMTKNKFVEMIMTLARDMPAEYELVSDELEELAESFWNYIYFNN